jgi:hypothetical protein
MASNRYLRQIVFIATTQPARTKIFGSAVKRNYFRLEVPETKAVD